MSKRTTFARRARRLRSERGRAHRAGPRVGVAGLAGLFYEAMGELADNALAPFSTLASILGNSLSAGATLRIDLASATDAYLFLHSRAGAARTSVEASDLGSILASDDDSGSGRNARISRALTRGTYAIEATTFRRDATGSFTLTLAASAAPTPTYLASWDLAICRL